jgi:hypothetical protein
MMDNNELEQIIKYAQLVDKALNGEDSCLPRGETGDHPFRGFEIESLKYLVREDILKQNQKAFEDKLLKEMKENFKSFTVGTPVKVTKGGKEKKGIEGIILFAKNPSQGNGKLLYIYDVYTHRNCLVRSSAVKPRLPRYGERVVLGQTYKFGMENHAKFACGSTVELKSVPGSRGQIVSSDGAFLDINMEGYGFYQVKVDFKADSRIYSKGVYTLTELNLLGDG